MMQHQVISFHDTDYLITVHDKIGLLWQLNMINSLWHSVVVMQFGHINLGCIWLR